MNEVKIDTLEKLEKFVLDNKISKLDKYLVFKEVLKNYPITFIQIILNNDEAKNGIEDPDERLIPQMQKIISEIRADPTAKQYSCMSVTRNESDTPDVIIDFSE
ncbi:hypothetical protein ACQ9BO_15680 [Flavobacterium sp. P21]|uniref:hypothetical protein n=1 Tax=Flavobacterium sp. P21 TaxID=3423948 RepID=UPI003D67FEE1